MSILNLPMSQTTTDHNYDENDGPGFFRRFWLLLLVGALALSAAGAVMYQLATHKTPPPTREQVITMVNLQPPPAPPPPPPPPPPQVQEDKMVEQTPIVDEPPPDDTPAPQQAVATSIIGNGPPDGFGVGAANGSGTRLGGTAAPRSQFGWYAAQVQATISEALRKNPATRNASFRLDVRVWPDLTGRITSAKLASSTGDSAVDATIEREILTGLQLQQPPPADMKLPIVMRFTARRPN